MSGSPLNHHRFVRNAALLNLFGKKGCQAFYETVKLQLSAQRRYVYPDLVLSCNPFDSTQQRIDFTQHRMIYPPVLGKKVDYYKSLSSLQTYLIIDQDEPSIRLYEHAATGEWGEWLADRVITGQAC